MRIGTIVERVSRGDVLDEIGERVGVPGERACALLYILRRAGVVHHKRPAVSLVPCDAGV